VCLGEEPNVTSIGRASGLSQTEVVAGFQRPESRPWERSAEPEVRFLSCRSEIRARSNIRDTPLHEYPIQQSCISKYPYERC
jgi:hypothetical protein